LRKPRAARIGERFVVQVLFREVQGYGYVETVSYSPKPALPLPSRQELGGGAPVNPKSPGRNIDRHDFLRGAKYGGKPGAGGRQ